MEKQYYFQTNRFRLPEETYKHENNLLLYMNKFDRRIYSNKKYDSLIQTFFKIIIGTTIGRMTRMGPAKSKNHWSRIARNILNFVLNFFIVYFVFLIMRYLFTSVIINRKHKPLNTKTLYPQTLVSPKINLL